MILVLISIVFGALRVAGVKTSFFQALAHVWVGGLFGAWLERRTNWFAFWLAIGLTVLEVACAIYFKRFAGGTP